MPLSIARDLARALNVKSETRVRAIDRALEGYVRGVRQDPTTEVTGSISEAQLPAGTLVADGTQTTVGAAGAAAALPATPEGYVEVTISSQQFVIPYYSKS